MPNVEFLKAFAEAWNSHDVDQIMQHMTDDCVFVSSDGARAEGGEVVRRIFTSVLDALLDANFADDRHFVSGDRGLSEWLFTGTDVDDGTEVCKRGCDVFTFKDGLIALKDTYLKA